MDDQESETHKFFMDIIEVMVKQPKCKGILLWEPQGARVWSNYPLSAWNSTGTPSNVLKAFCNIKK
jgi:arabinogalactan endo-1,4-beta-galactosidase